MLALTYHGSHDVRVDNHPDRIIKEAVVNAGVSHGSRKVILRP